MSGWKEPIGAKGKSVYLRRRIFVLLGVIAVAAAIVLVIFKPGSSGGAASSPDVDIPDDLVAAEQAKSGADNADVPVCGDGQILVIPLTDRESYAAGELPQLSLSVENVGEEPCTADLGTAGMAFEVTSGADSVWRSADCQKNADHRAVILKPNEPLTTEAVPWDRTRSSPESCDISRDAVTAGGASYHLHVAAAGVDGDGSVQFLLY